MADTETNEPRYTLEEIKSRVFTERVAKALWEAHAPDGLSTAQKNLEAIVDAAFYKPQDPEQKQGHAQRMPDWHCKCDAANRPHRTLCWRCGAERPEDRKQEIEQLETERDLWKSRYLRIMGWVIWLRDSVCRWIERPAARRSWQGLNRMVGTEDLFLASYEIEAEVAADAVEVNRLAASKDRQFRAIALEAAERSTTAGKPQGEDAPDA